MRDVGYITAGFVLTFGVVAGYLLSLRTRLRRARHTYRLLADGEPR